jgi:hypothetical protein
MGVSDPNPSCTYGKQFAKKSPAKTPSAEQQIIELANIDALKLCGGGILKAKLNRGAQLIIFLVLSRRFFTSIELYY